MTSARWQRVQDLFETLESIDDGERAAFLVRAESDPDVRKDALALLEAARGEREATLRLTAPSSTGPEGTEMLPERVGRYRILGALGSGGFSTVYSAVNGTGAGGREQRVAVKVFHAHRLGPDAQRRFEREQKLLASLNHPGIVRFLDAGVTSEGRPYLAMEEVTGATITEHCDGHRLGIGERVKLVADACSALQDAHRHLIVHLDLKPSNILVTAGGQVKILDFGTAKLIDDTGAPTVTQQLTPLYASPERLRGEAGSVSSDIYGIGLILYELLTGGWPFRDRASISAIADRATGAQPPAPLHHACSADSAAARGISDERLRRMVQGDLQAICSKALAHEPRERYGSMTELAEDLRRYRDGEPVLAHEPGALYRARKFVRRRLRSLAVVSVAAALLAGAAGYAWRERIQGARRLEEARGMAKYLLFDLYDRINELPGSTAVRAHMAEQAQTQLDRLSRLSGADPAIRFEAAAGYDRLAEIQGISGSSSLGNTEAAALNLRHARELLERLLAERPGDRKARVEIARNALLGAKLQNWNRRNTAGAKPLIEEARRHLQQAASGGAPDPDWYRVHSTLAIQQADLAEFERAYSEEDRIASAALAELSTWPAPLQSGADYLLRRVALLKRRGNAAYHQEKFQESLRQYQEAESSLHQFDRQYPNRPEVLYSLMDMQYQAAYALGELKNPRGMLEATQRSLAVGARLVEHDGGNESLRRSYWNKRQALAESLAELRRFDEAVREEEAVLEARLAARRSQPDSNLAAEDVLVSEFTLVRILLAAGHSARACALARNTLDRSRELQAAGGMTAKNWDEQEQGLNKALKGCPAR